MKGPCVLGLDLGTSGLKAVLLSAGGRLLAEASAPLEVQRPQPDWSEQHPADWLSAADLAVRRLRERAAPADWQAVRALAVAGQMHGAVLLDAAGEVLRPAMLWNDGRSQGQCSTLEQRLPQGRHIAANPAMAGFTAPKLQWVAEHEPECFARVAKVLLPKDWLGWQLHGEMVTEASDASGTWWLDVAVRRWSADLLAATGLTPSHMPELHEGPDVVGRLRPQWCHAWGLPPDVKMAAGAGDNAAGAIGVGAVRPGNGFVSLGTSGVLFVVTGEARACPERAVHSFCHALPDTWHQMAVMLSAASALTWLGAVTGADAAALLAGVEDRPRPEAPLFLPYLSGERTPHADPAARASLLGLGAGTTRDDLAYAVIEGVAFAFADGLQALRAAGTEPGHLLALGGGARSDVWLQLLADVLGLRLSRPAGAEVGPALGAARLAQLALGLPAAEVLKAPVLARQFNPRPDHQTLLAGRLERFRRAWEPCRSLSRPG